MDPAPQSRPILSYILSRLPTLSTRPRHPTGGGEFNIEQPPVHTPSPRTPSNAGEFELVERMSGLRHPSVLPAMTRAVADVSAACSELQVLGPRPDHKLVDSSHAIIVVAAGDEDEGFREALLQEAEGRLEAVYRSAMRGKDLEECDSDGKGQSAAAATGGTEGGDAAVLEEVIAARRGRLTRDLGERRGRGDERCAGGEERCGRGEERMQERRKAARAGGRIGVDEGFLDW